MTTLSPAVQGDVNDRRLLRLDGVETLNAVTGIVAHVWRRGVDPVALSVVVVDAAARTVEIVLGGADGWLADAEPGTWWVEVQATFADGSILTWPARRPAAIAVRADGDPF